MMPDLNNKPHLSLDEPIAEWADRHMDANPKGPGVCRLRNALWNTNRICTFGELLSGGRRMLGLVKNLGPSSVSLAEQWLREDGVEVTVSGRYSLPANTQSDFSTKQIAQPRSAFEELRDQFAMAALGIARKELRRHSRPDARHMHVWYLAIAEESYAMADAMMEARKKQAEV